MIRQLKKSFDWLRTRKIRAFDIVLIVLLFTSYMVSVLLGFDITLNLDFNIKIESGYFCISDKQGGVYVIDKGQKRLFKVKDHKVEWEMSVDKEEKICQIENVIVGDDGSVYIYETKWDDTGWLLNNELIKKYGADGKYIETKYTISYDENNKKDRPTLFDLKIVDDHLECIRLNDHGFELFKIVNDEAVVKSHYLFDDALHLIQYITVSPTNNIYMADRRGKVLCVDEKGNIYTYCDLKDEVVPNDLSVESDESIYFTDLRSKSVNIIYHNKETEEVFSTANMSEDETNKNLIFYVSANRVTFEDGTEQDVLCTIIDYERLYVVKQDGEVLYNQCSFEPGEKLFTLHIISFLISAIITLCAVMLAIRLIYIVLFNGFKLRLLFFIEIIIVATTIVILIATLPLTLSATYDAYFGGMSQEVITMAETAAKTIDPEKLRNLNKSSDVMGDDYKYVLEKMKIATFDYDGSEQPTRGGTVERIIDNIAFDVIYSHMRTGTFVPTDDSIKKEIMEVYETKKSMVINIKTIIGEYIIARSPVIDSNGEVVGCVCIQQNAEQIRNEYNSIIQKISADWIVVIILLILILNEVIAFIQSRKEYKEKIKDKQYLGTGERVFPHHIIRLSTAIFSMSINISAGFLPVYALSFHSQYLSDKGISTIFAASLPLSINTAFIFLSSVLSLSVFAKFGFKKVIIFAVCCSLLSDIMLTQASVYSTLVFALALNGLGYGLLSESKRSYLSKLSYDELNRVQIFCSSGAGSGQLFGLLIGGFLAITFRYNDIFWMAVLIDIVALGFCIYFCKTYVGGRPAIKRVGRTFRMSTLKFLAYKKNLVYLTVIPFIWGIIAGFAGYYIPIFGSTYNLYKSQISALLCCAGIFAVFFASSMTKVVIEKFGTNSIYVAILTALSGMLMIVYFDYRALSLILSVLVLGVAYSFGLGSFRYKFRQLHQIKEYGENRAQSIYTLFCTIGIFMSPQLFGYMVEQGTVRCMWWFAIIVVAIMFLYKIVFDRKKNAN